MRHRFRGSLSARVLAVLAITVLPVIISLFLVNFYAVRRVRSETFATNEDILSVYMDEVDARLRTASTTLRHLDANQVYVADFQSSNEQNGYYASNNYSRALTNAITAHPGIDGFLIFSSSSDRLVYAFNSTTRQSFTAREQLLTHFSNTFIYEDASLNTWHLDDISGKYYLLYAHRLHDTYFCAWVNLETLLGPMKEWKTAESATLLLLSTGDEWSVAPYASATATSPLPTTDASLWQLDVISRVGAFKLVELIDADVTLRPFLYIFHTAAAILLVFLLCLPWILRTLGRNVFRPIKRIRAGIAAVERGDFEQRIPQDGTDNDEFRTLIEAFNSMTGQIKHLRIQAYEDALERSRLELQFLQAQVEPHFYLNALNTINAMAQVGDTALIQDLSRSLSEYMRYLSTSRLKPVPLQDELRHIENHLAILRSRLEESFRLDIRVETGCENITIPPLLVQTLVENSLKYAFDVYTETTVTVEVYRERSGEHPGVVILVRDTGPGYPEEVLAAVNNGAEAAFEKRIGLANSRRRLFYLFGEEARFTVGNCEGGGAETRIWLPVEEEEKE